MTANRITTATDPRDVQVEFEKSRESAARLMESLAQKIGAVKAVREAAGGIERAARYVYGYPVKDTVGAMNRLVRRRPIWSITLAVVAGFLVGRALRPR